MYMYIYVHIHVHVHMYITTAVYVQCHVYLAYFLKCNVRHAYLYMFQGQWRGGVYHGEGSISHCSGVSYMGMWTNGTPTGQYCTLCSHTVNVHSSILVYVHTILQAINRQSRHGEQTLPHTSTCNYYIHVLSRNGLEKLKLCTCMCTCTCTCIIHV